MEKTLKKLQGFLSKNGFYPGYDENYKSAFRTLGQAFLKDVAKSLELTEFKVDYNKAGIACSGDHTLIGMRNGKGIYISFNFDGVVTNGNITSPFVLYRTVKHMKDWSGGGNNFTAIIGYSEEVTAETLLRRFNSLLG